MKKPEVYERDAIASLVQALSVLSEIEREVIEQRFWSSRTLEQIGQLLGLCRQRVSQIEAKALRRLRRQPILEKLLDAAEEFGLSGLVEDYKRVCSLRDKQSRQAVSGDTFRPPSSLSPKGAITITCAADISELFTKAQHALDREFEKITGGFFSAN